MISLFRPIILSFVILASSSHALAVTTISSSAHAVSSTVKVVGTVGVAVGPLAATSGTASPAYDADSSVASLDTEIALGVVGGTRAGLGLETGLLTSNSTANGTLPGDTTSGSAMAQVNDLGLDLFTKISILPAITTLGLGADTITSMTSVNRVGTGAVLVGSSVFENLDLQLLGLLNFGLGVNAQVSPNFVLVDALGLRIVLNEQIVGGNGGDFQSLTTNALNIGFVDYLLGGRLLTGNVIIASSYAEIRFDDPDPVGAVPEPAVWLQLVTGFGLTGFAVRRRKASKATI